jgi:uncharacterized protein
MGEKEVTAETINFVRTTLANAEGGHDWWHIHRVRKLTKYIGTTENSNLYIGDLGALLHDIADSKFHNGDEEIGPIKARDFLRNHSVDNYIIDQVEFIIRNISFKGGKDTLLERTLELDVVQDADRLDAMGAIGIARTFNYGGHTGREIYNPEIIPNLQMTKEEYKKSQGPTLNHFYEKLLLLKDRMNTETGKILAQQRHEFMERYLEQFHAEWEGIR